MASRARLAILGLAVAAGVGGGLALREWRSGEGGIVWVESDAEALAEAQPEIARRAAEDSAPGGLKRTHLPESVVENMMPLKQSREYDPHCYFVARPNRTYERTWREHPEGGFVIRTNSLGLRMDFDPAPEKPDLRILVAGDSHMAGVCNNSEGTAGRLQALLQGNDPARTVEVVNGSQGAYSFYHYLGVLERMQALGHPPDLMVVVVYGGNDFVAVWMWHFFEGSKRYRLTGPQARLKRAIAESHSNPMGQVLNAASYFTWAGEDEVENALTCARQATAEIARRCAEEEIGLLVVLLPAPSELPGCAPQEAIDGGLEALGLTRGDAGILGEMGARYLEDVRELGVPLLDLTPTFREANRPLYWERDLHLSVDGHDLAARTVLPWVERWWAEH